MLRPSENRPTLPLRHLLFALLAAAVFVQCASIAQPQGGPRDSLPPLIISTNPLPRSINFTGKRITLNFNEYIVLKDQQKEFVMSPPSDKKPMLTVKGRSIVVDFENQPDSNTTYRLDFGNSIADNNEGNKLGGYSYIFSTGPDIDSLMMSGLVLDAQTRDSIVEALVFYFDAKADSLAAYDSVMYKARPQALFRTDSSGLFLADILRNQDYLAYAILDKNGNQKYEAGTDYIAMLDSAVNPTRLPDFDMWIDPAKGRMGPRRRIDPPQLLFELFLEEPVRKQTILKSNRPDRQRLELIFNSKQADIVSFQPTGFDSTWLMRQNGIKGDTVWYWIAPPTKADVEALKDTIRAKITYVTQDSLWRPQLKTENLTFVHRIIDPNARGRRPNTHYADSVKQVKTAKKAAKRSAKLQRKWLKAARKISRKRGDPPRPDSVLLKDSTLFKQVKVDTTQRDRNADIEPAEKNPFGYNVQAANPLNPETHIRLAFDYPLRSLDSTRITLTRLTDAETKPGSGRRSARTTEPTEKTEKAEKKETPVPFRIAIDSTSLERRISIIAPWVADDEYKLLIPDSVFTNIAYQSNDTLQATFKIADYNKFGTLILQPNGDSIARQHEYILELQNPEGKTITKLTHARAGQEYTIRYLAPGKYQLRVTEDRNKNGIWDTGSLTQRRQPERVRIWKHPTLGPEIEAKQNWDVPIPIDLNDLFSKP